MQSCSVREHLESCRSWRVQSSTDGNVWTPLQKDGKCDDGSTGEEKQVFCDLGTDCSDCGPWTFKVPSQQPNQSQPIKLLHGRKVSGSFRSPGCYIEGKIISVLPIRLLHSMKASTLFVPVKLHSYRQI